MTIERMIELLEIEHECMRRGAHSECDRDCARCELVQDDQELDEMYTGVIALLKEQDKLLHKKQKDIDRLCTEISEWKHKFHDKSLKEQDAKYPVCEKCGKKIDHIITSVFNYDGSDSEYSFPITYDENGGCIQFSTTQNWTGYELSDAEQKDSIRCPFCREFPFDANEEIELYEPEEVVVMMWEGR